MTGTTENEPDVFTDAQSNQLNPEWVKYQENRDAAIDRHNSYFLSGPTIALHVRCHSDKCLLRSKGPEFHDVSTSHVCFEPMLLCFTCNNAMHVKCANLTLSRYLSESLPWRCTVCQVDIHNPVASAYLKATRYATTLRERRKPFLKKGHKEDTILDKPEGFFEVEDLAAFEQERESWTAYKTAEEFSQLEEQNRTLSEQINKLVEAFKLQNTSASFPVDDRKNSTTVGGDADETFNFSKHYGTQKTLPPGSEQAGSRYNPAPPPAFRFTTTDTSQVNPADISEIVKSFAATQQQLLEEQILANRRKIMPKIADFDGDPLKWIEFVQDVERYQKVCRYDDEAVKLHLRNALKGAAFEAVKGVFNLMSLSQLMKTLKKSFGDPMFLIKKHEQEIRDFRIKGELFHEDALKLRQLIQNYFTVCTYGGFGYLGSHTLGEELYGQMATEDRKAIRKMVLKKDPEAIVVVNLSTLYEFLLSYTAMLDRRSVIQKSETSRRDEKKSQSNQLNYTTTSSHTEPRHASPVMNQRDEVMFSITSKESSPLGYDMRKVNELKKFCPICNKTGHYPVSCYLYRAMTNQQRLSCVNEKRICRNCVLTTDHMARQCDLKKQCNFKAKNGSRCNAHHHISLHLGIANSEQNSQSRQSTATKPPNKGNTNRNTDRARQAISQQQRNSVASVSQEVEEKFAQETHSAPASTNFHALNPRDYPVRRPDGVGLIQVNLHAAMSFQKTVKMFKHDFIGPKGITTAFSVGDSGAEVTLVRDDLRVALGIDGVDEMLSISWADDTMKLCKAKRFDMTVQGLQPHANKLTLRDCYSIEDLNLPHRTMDMKYMRSKFPYLNGIAFDGYNHEQPVMLIGTPHASVVENSGLMRKGGENDPIGIETELGASVFGGHPINQHTSVAVQAVSLARAPGENANEEGELLETRRQVTNEELYDLLKRFNSIESVGIRPAGHYLIEEERKALEILEEEMTTLSNGTVEVPLVWNRDEHKRIPRIANNYSLAFKRQLALEKKLSKNPQHLQAYNSNVKELLELGYMRAANDVDLQGNWQNVWYLPMGLVVNANKDPPKFRNIYDARSKFQGQSLNDLLLKGPDLLINLLKPLMRIRMEAIAVSADVKHMYHRVAICLRDQQVQRVLWRESPDKPMSIMILNVMAFGPKSSPFVSQYVKNWNANNWKEIYPEAAKIAKELVYMDDVLMSTSSADKATRMAKQLIEMFDFINWELVSFQSNSKEFLESLPNNCVKKDLIPILQDEEREHITKVLGCSWSTKEDAFIFQLDKNIFVQLMTEFEHKPTKKDLASLIARIFDVMGFIAHYVIRGKILLQRTWKLKIGWDDEIPVELLSEWKLWLNDINQIARLRIPRKISQLDSLRDADSIQLHTFCDAGVEAFGAAAYLVVKTANVVTSRLVLAKAKVTPLRFHTETEVKEIPRLELMSALIAARISKSIMDAYSDIEMERFYWSDSEVVLRWLINPNHRLLKYAVGPVEEILEVSERAQWRYVPSILNPADTCTKFKAFDFSDSESIWFTGPDFIRKGQHEWPVMPERLLANGAALIYNIYLRQLNYSTHKLPPPEFEYIIDNLSPSIQASWDKLRRAVARGIKIMMDGIVPAVRAKQFNSKHFRKDLKELHHRFQVLSPADLERAEHFIFRKMQREDFAEEYKALKEGKRVRNQEFQRLNVFIDPEGLLRINSRAQLNDISFPQQYAPILPRANEFTYLMQRHYHIKYDHIAIESQMAELRTRCWIPRLRSTLKVTKARCNECKLRDRRMYEPEMAPLPDYRIDPSCQPFEVVALDCFGPYMVKCSGKYKKIWVLIFTCTLTRFVHLHILESLESLRVMEAIAMFWAAHGPVRKFVSDNGLNFVGAARAIQQDREDAKQILRRQHAILTPRLSEKYDVDWEFIPPYSPWMGGVYERLIKEVKRALYEILHKKKIDKISLNIAISEVSHRLNLRPLTHNSVSADDGVVLTPHHLAKNRSGWPLLPGIHKGSYANIDDKDVYHKGRAVADQIMAKFTANYLPEYARRTKWFKEKRSIRNDDLVLIIEPRDTRKEFTRGRVVKVRGSKDGKGRKAEIRLPDGRIKLCSVRNLARLDVSI